MVEVEVEVRVEMEVEVEVDAEVEVEAEAVGEEVFCGGARVNDIVVDSVTISKLAAVAGGGVLKSAFWHVNMCSSG